MRHLLLALLTLLALVGCAETVRCPDDQVFDDDGECVPIPDAGPSDAGATDAGDGG